MAINITDAAREKRITPVLRMPFRPFFLGAAGFSCLALTAWLANFLSGVQLGGVGLYWHIHEMIFGFAATTVVGFALTAGQTWTGVPTVRGAPLALLVLVWLAARLAWLLPPPQQWLAALLDAVFFTFAAAVIGRMVLLSNNWRNLFFLPLFLVIALISLGYGYLLMEGEMAAARHLLLLVLLLISHVVLVIGGRVIPFFSDRALQREPLEREGWSEYASLGGSLVFITTFALWGDSVPGAAAAAVVAAANLRRWLRWRPWQSRGVPLLWSLYIAYGFVICGFLALALRAPFSVSIHLLAVGGFGLMILAMISRVCLGHTGRPLQLPPGFPLAYLALVAATLCRAAAGLLPAHYGTLLWLSGGLWIAGFALFLYHYGPILLSPRADGRPG